MFELILEPNPEAWSTDALCRDQLHPDYWFPDGDERRHTEHAMTFAVRRALDVCQECPVRAACLDYALRHRIEHGVWGGTTAPTRRRLRRGAS